MQNPDKTENNTLIQGYECSPEHAAEEFANAQEEYKANTSRTQNNSRMLYHMRQSFAPGEIDAQTANQIGYQLALEFTKGQHAFVVATHTDKAHIHNHVIFNAVNLNCDGKFHDPWFSGKKVVAKISDKLCKEYGLSVIKVRKGWGDLGRIGEQQTKFATSPYNKWEQKKGITKEGKPPTKRKRLENIITMCLNKQPKDFDQLLKMLEEYSCTAKRRGRNITITAPFSKNPMRLSSLAYDFTEHGIREQIAKQQNIQHENTFEEESIAPVKQANIKTTENITTLEPPQPKQLQLLIDIQNSLKATENIGYKKWAEKFNLEQMSQTLLFIEKHQLTLTQLENMATQRPQQLANIKSEIAVTDEKLQQISQLQRQIGTYGKTKEIYKQYKQQNSSDEFWQQYNETITAHELAKEYFDKCGYGYGSGDKLPTIKELREEYAKLNLHKKSQWENYYTVKNSGVETDNAWRNVSTILNLKQTEPQKATTPSL